MGMHEGRGMLAKGMKELTHRWLEAKGDWRDAVAEQFEKRYMETIERDLKVAIAAMDHVGGMLHKIRNECQ